jgi:hypothetical protein
VGPQDDCEATGVSAGRPSDETKKNNLKIEVAVFLPLPHPKNKAGVDSTEVEVYSYTQLPHD